MQGRQREARRDRGPTGRRLGRWLRTALGGRGPVRALNLALQGGGAHGAFTWGVLDRLLEEPWLALRGISGTSAGALNATVLAAGWQDGGREGARTALATLWRRIGEVARLSPLRHGRLPHLALDLTAHLLSPYQLNPLGINPLRATLDGLVDFDRLRNQPAPELFLAATNVRTGAARIFERRELCAEAVLASACLPQVHPAVELDGEAYWDGGYVSNPPLLMLVERCPAPETVLVQINPLACPDLPTGALAIRNRLGEIVFGRALAEELGRLEQKTRAARRGLGRLDPGRRHLARHRLHVIDGSPSLSRLGPITKLVPDEPTLFHLHELGRAAAASWLGNESGERDQDEPGTAADASGSVMLRA